MSANRLYKVWDHMRTTKKCVVASSLDELIVKSCAKLGIATIRLVMEKDGTDVDEEEVLFEFITKDDVLMALEPTQHWTAIETVVNLFTEPATGTDVGPSHDQLSTSALPPAATSAIPPAATSTTSATTSKSVPPATTSVPVPTTTSQSLPIFSDYVVANVLSNDTHLVWNKMINETAYYYMAMNPEMGRDNSSSDYRHVGQAMYKKYPYIGRSGTQPWTLFTTNLSQKIRRVRWDNKRKSASDDNRQPPDPSKKTTTPVTPKRFRFTPDSAEGGPDDDNYDAHVAEISTEMGKRDPNLAHVKTLLQASQRQRRLWISNLPDGNVSVIMDKFPCFRKSAFLMTELKQLLKLKSIKPVFRRFEQLFEAGASLRKNKKADDDDLDTLAYLENETSYRHGKGQKTKSVLQTVVIGETSNVEKALSSTKGAPPSLAVVKNEKEVVNFAILADGVSIVLHTHCVPEAVSQLMAFYYTMDLDYPRCFAQLLGFIQQVALQQPFQAQKTAGFLQLLKKIKIE